MRIISFLILILFSAPSLLAYTVVLKSGKRIEGTFVAENNATVQIKDSRGVLLSFKRELLDLDCMTRDNEHPESVSPHPVPEAAGVETPSREIDLVAFAEQIKKRRKGNAHRVTKEDLDSSPELTILGTEETQRPNEAEPISDREEQRWRKEALSLKKEISRLRERRISAQTSCQKAEQHFAAKRLKPSREPGPILSSFDKPSECARLTEFDRQIQEAEWRLEDFEERARRAEVPWQWIE